MKIGRLAVAPTRVFSREKNNGNAANWQHRFNDFNSGLRALGTTQYGPIDVKEATEAVNKAINAGINLIDTAEGYGPYHSESILEEALKSRRDEEEGAPTYIDEPQAV